MVLDAITMEIFSQVPGTEYRYIVLKPNYWERYLYQNSEPPTVASEDLMEIAST